MKKVFVAIILLLGLAAVGLTQQPAIKGDPITATTLKPGDLVPAVIPAPKEGRLTWENHRLRSANIGLQIEKLQQQQALEDKAAEAAIAEMQAVVGDRYSPRLNQQTGLLEFYLKEPPKPSKP